MGEVYVYEPNADDLDCMGCCGALTPTSCIHTEEANGMSEIELRHPIDEHGRWSFLLDGCLLKVEVPVRTTPEIKDGALVTTVEKWIVKPTASKASRYIYTKATKGKKKKLLPKGYELTVVAKGDARHKIKSKKYGTGWVSVNAIQYTLTETIPNDPAAIEQVEPAWSVRTQMFRIYCHEVTESGVIARARHVFYDLLGNCTTYDGSTAALENNPTCVEAGEGILNGCVCDHDFEFYSNMLDTRAAVHWTRQNPVTALLDPEEGLCAQWQAEIVRDDWDIIVLREAGFNRGTRIEYAKNLLGVKCEVDSTDVITRIIPVGQTAKGAALLLVGDSPWVDSPQIANYPVPHVHVLDLGSKVKAKSTKSADVTSARSKLAQMARDKFTDESCDEPSLSLEVDFINLGDTEEYRDYAQLEALFLYDRVRVRHPDLMIDVLCEVKRMEFDCLTGRVKKIELGSVKFLSKAQPVTRWQLPSGINAGVKLAWDSIDTQLIAGGAVTAKSLAVGAVEEDAILDGSVSPAKLKVGFFEADEIRAAVATIALANITTANIQNANIDWAQITNLATQMATIAKAQITSATIEQANINWADIATLNAQIATIAAAQITTANIKSANIQWAEIASLSASVATIAKAQITTATIGQANIDWAQIATLNTSIASIAKAQITTANISAANIDWAQIASLSSTIATIAKAQITTANITAANIEWANIAALNTSIASIAKAQITTANINSANINWAQIASLQAGILETINARIGAASIDYAQIKDLVSNTAIITTGTAGQLYINRLCVTEANIVSLTVGELMLKGEDGQFYKLTTDSTGKVSTVPVKVEGSNVANSTLSGGNLIQDTITARELNVASIFADSAMIGAIKAININVGDLFASNTYTSALRTSIIQSDIGTALNISSNAAILLKADKTVTDGLSTRLTAAEQKITPDSIISTVRGSSQYTADLASKVAASTYNTDMAKKLDSATYTTDKAALLAADVAVGSAAPSSPPAGKLWVDTSSTPQLKRWTGSAWQVVTDISKADAAALTALTTRVSTAETNITQTQNSISLKADKSVTDGLASRMTSAESKITPDAITSTVRNSTAYTNDLAAKLATSTYNTDKSALQAADVAVGSTAPSSPASGKLWVDTSSTPQLKRWTGSTWQVVTDLSKADAAALTSLTTRVTSAETSITQTQNSISLKADKTVTDGLNTRLTNAESKITDTAIVNTVRGSSAYTSDLAAKLATSTYNTDKTALQAADVSVGASTPSSPPAGKLWVDTSSTPQLKRWAGSSWQVVTDLSKADAAALTALTTRVSTAETNITQTQTSISLKADKSVIDGLASRMTSAESKITDTAIVNTVRSSSSYTSDLAAKVATSTYNSGMASKTDKTLPDTRNDNQPPSWYWSNYPRQKISEFKGRNAIGAPGTTTYGALTTMVPWSDSSGGQIIQAFESTDGTYERRSTSTTAWGDWAQIADQKKIDALSSRISTAETSITQTQSSIALKADKTVTDGLASRMTSAESKITDNAIINTVTGSATYKGDKVFAQTTAPTSPTTNMKWLDTSAEPSLLKVYDGTSWEIVGGDVQAKLDQLGTSITQTADQISHYVSKADQSRYMTFDTTNGVLIGDTSSNFKVQILSDRINILQNSNRIAYFASNKLFIQEGELTSNLIIGNYGLKKTTDGGIAIG
ncbi:phage tail protein [Eubacteriales bacterium OttesenSCG-928-N13]|nr:phage tail protein [Eubacteriales bacterium OttesenSCG-928-N13]